MDGDIVLNLNILKKFVDFSKKNSALVGKGNIKDAECAKVFVNKNNMIKYMIDKTLASKEILNNHKFLGEAIGVIKLDDKYKNKFIKILKKFLLKKKNFKKNWEKPLNEFMRNSNLDYFFTKSKKWIEIDSKRDYEQAKKIFS